MNEHDESNTHIKLTACAITPTEGWIPHAETEKSQKNWSFLSLLKAVANPD